MLTRQEMFNRAWNGLKQQGFQRCMVHLAMGDKCAYTDGQGRHCAWGWVDPEGTESVPNMSVEELKSSGRGLAGTLTSSDVVFAQALQNAHDNAPEPSVMEQKLRNFAIDWRLTVPEEVVP